ncbi:MAG TPA: PBP1A family penicillin-binding protein [Vicinamibacterales bacterium]|nr:PBP1A family penicillin-binding protein [Vicinamibacterales bacterium]
MPLPQLRRLTAEVRQLSRRYPVLVRSVLAGFGVVAFLSFALPLWYLVDLQRGLPDQDAIGRIGEMDQATTVYDNQDQLVFTIFKQRRIDTDLARVSPHLVRAVLAIEDQRFYDHDGFDVIRTLSAALSNVRRQRVAQGGSTITQQLARQSFLTPDKTLRRKLQELILASRIEDRYSKEEILQLYLNKVYFGDGWYGVEAASQGYFGKSAADLSVSDAALLAGLVQSPSRYAPSINMDLAVARRNVVLQAMLDTRAIDRATWEGARATKVTLAEGLGAEEPHGQYFKEQVRQELVERFGWERVYEGGLRVFTTIDMPMQIAAEAAAAEALKTLDARRQALLLRRAAGRNNVPTDPEPLQAALVALDPATGHVRAMVGGRDFSESRFNRAVQARRQPGSAFKPFVYAAALEAGFTPASVVDRLNDPIATPEGDWVPDDGHSTDDAMTLRTGLRTSSNRAAVRLLQEVGIPNTVQYAKMLGVGDVPSVPSLALGSGEVTLESMTAAYAAFANQGNVPTPLTIRRVEDRDGRLLFKAEEKAVRAVSEITAFLISNMMADVVNAGTAAGVRRLGFTLPAAGKTGTTNDFFDAWFVGYTPKLVTGVWVGFDQPRTILPNGFAADVAVPFWAMFMKAATEGDAPEWFKTPPGVTTATVCRISGKLASEGCEHVEVISDSRLETRSMVYTEFFSRGSEPTEYCDLHQRRGLFGTLAGIFSDRPAQPFIAEPAPAVSGSTVQVAAAIKPEASEVIPPSPEPEKKRGFWSKLFGRGNDNNRNSRDSQDSKAKDSKKN